VTISRSAVSVSRAAAAESTVGVACSAAEVLSASSIVASTSSRRRSRLRGVVAAGEAASSAVGRSVSTPSVRAAARAGVHGALGVAKQVAVVGSTLSVGGVLAVLPLLDEANGRAGGDLGGELGVLEVGSTGVLLCAVLASQALEGIGSAEVARGVDPEKVDVGRGEPSEGAEGQDRALHGGWMMCK
jgi:hypothetical protein